MKKLGWLLSLAFIGALVGGCDNQEIPILGQTVAPGNLCSATAAEIGVFDGYLETLCGCQEANGTIAQPPNPLTCTVPAGTTIFFLYLNTKLTHQILSSGTPSFLSSPPNIPTSTLPIHVHTVVFDTAGTYQFIDAYNGSMSGSIVVQ